MSNEKADRVAELAEKFGHIGRAMDEANRELIPEANRCGSCNGTGNMLFSMYFRCLACGGDGLSRGKEAEAAADLKFNEQFSKRRFT